MNIYKLTGRELLALIYISKLGGINHAISLSTSQLANVLSMSQQSASRLLVKMDADLKLIEWHPSPRGSKVKITLLGETVLHKLNYELELALNPELKSIIIRGTVFSGLGEGKYYITRLPYMRSFKEKLGIEPYPGTLNLRVSPGYVNKLDLVRGSWPIIIPGFEEEGRKFGEVLCYEGRISGLEKPVFLIVPRRTHYRKNVMEIISNVYLRKILNLKDGDKVTIEFPLTQQGYDTNDRRNA